MSSKITIIGAGSVGATIAYTLSSQDIASEIVLIDINKQKAEGEVLDIIQGTCFRDPISIIAGDYEDAKDSDIVIITVPSLTLHVCVADYPSISRLHRVTSMLMYSASTVIHLSFHGQALIFQVSA